MKILCFKFNQNHTINDEYDFWGVKGGGREGMSRILKFGEAQT